MLIFLYIQSSRIFENMRIDEIGSRKTNIDEIGFEKDDNSENAYTYDS